MSLSVLKLAALTALGTGVSSAAMGPAFSTGPVANGSFIKSATSTLILPKVPSTNQGDLSLWVGMGTSNGDLIQSIADSTDKAPWTIFTYTLKDDNGTQVPIMGDPINAEVGDHITMDYVFNKHTGNYTQNLGLNGKVVQTLSTSDAQALGWGTAVECAADNCGAVHAHEWINTRIVLSQADPEYINTNGKSQGVTGNLTTKDGGLTWTVDTIHIPRTVF